MSLIDAEIANTAPVTPEGGVVDPNAATPPSGVPVSNPDPFGDLKDYQDGETGLYLGKYKDLRSVMEGYKELSAKVREKLPDAPEKPEDYKFVFEGEKALEGYELTMEDPMWKEMAPVFKDVGLSNEQAQKLVSSYLKFSLANQPDLEAEKAKLGSEADAIINEVVGYAQKRNSPAMLRLAEAAGENADTLKELHFLIKQSGEKAIPPRLVGVVGKTSDDLFEEAYAYREKHKNIIDSSPSHQRIYDDMMQKAARLKNQKR